MSDNPNPPSDPNSENPGWGAPPNWQQPQPNWQTQSGQAPPPPPPPPPSPPPPPGSGGPPTSPPPPPGQPPAGGGWNAPPPPGQGGFNQYQGPQPSHTNYLVWAIIETLCCCLPLGVAAIVFSAQANSARDRGDWAAAQSANNTAKILIFVGIGIGAVLVIGWAVLFGIGAIADSGSTSSNY